MPKRSPKMVHAGFGASRLPRTSNGPGKRWRDMPELKASGSMIKATKEQAEKLRSIVDGAMAAAGKPALGSSLEDLLDRDPVTVVEQAVAHLLREKTYRVTVAEFRSMVRRRKASDLRKALERLAKLLPETDSFPPWYQMRAVFTGGDPFADDLSHDGDMDKEDEWRERYAPGILLDAVRQHLTLMDRLEDELAKGRPVEVPTRRFVEVLAAYWKSTLGLQVVLSRADGPQRGRFQDFVNAARDVLPQGFKIGTLYSYIRDCSDG